MANGDNSDQGWLLAPDPDREDLTRAVTGTDHTGRVTDIRVVEERPLTIYLNAREIVTAMTIGDYPEYLALGFLRNQGMISAEDVVTGIDYDEEMVTPCGPMRPVSRSLDVAVEYVDSDGVRTMVPDAVVRAVDATDGRQVGSAAHFDPETALYSLRLGEDADDHQVLAANLR